MVNDSDLDVFERKSRRATISRPMLCVAASLIMLPAVSGHAGEAVQSQSRAGILLAADKVASKAAPAETVRPGSDEYLLDRGDRLRVKFFDRFDRDDLNGEYTIGESGKLRLPRLGQFDVRNMTTAEVESAVRQNVESRGEKLGYFSIDVAECRPFYVSGLANRPGAYAFVIGLTVSHAVALAGGIYRSPTSSAGESLRESSKVAETLEKLKEPLARKARLEAEFGGQRNVSVPADLAELDPVNAKVIIQREQGLVERARESDVRERTSLQRMIDYSQSEVDSFDTEISTMTKRIEEQSQLFDRLKTLHSQKIVNAGHFNQSLMALDSVQRDKQLAIAGLARAKAALEKSKKDLAMVGLAARLRIAKELADTDAEVSRLKSLAEEQRHLARQLDRMAGRASADDQVAYRVLRRNHSGVLFSLTVSETTPLIPGDILQIEVVRNETKISSE